MVVRDDRVSKEAPDACERIAKEGAADVADVHRLRDVWRGKINDEPSRRNGRDTKSLIAGECGEMRDERGWFQSEIDEASTSDFRRFAQICHIEFGDDFLRESARICPARLGQLHGHVGLIVTKSCILRGLHGDKNATAVTDCVT